jgi:hypothetical protein
MANPDVFSAANTAFFAAKPPEKVLIIDIVNVAIVRVASFTAFGPCGLLFKLRRMDGEGRSIRMRPSRLEFVFWDLAMSKHLLAQRRSFLHISEYLVQQKEHFFLLAVDSQLGLYKP